MRTRGAVLRQAPGRYEVVDLEHRMHAGRNIRGVIAFDRTAG